MGTTTSKDSFADIVSQLLTHDIDPADHEFWDELWKTQLTVLDIFSVISPDDVRKLINERPKNVQTLFTQAVAQLYQVVETPYPVYFDQALTCTRLLTRFLPTMLECETKVTKELFWSRQTHIKPVAPIENADPSEGTIETKGEDSSVAAVTPETQPTSEEETEVDTEPLSVILINSLFHLLFLPEFTIEDPEMEFNEDDLQSQKFKSALMWAPGVGSTEKSVVGSSQYDRNRIDILRLMISAFSDSLYQDPDTYDSCASLWLEVATSVDAPYAEIVFYSLMNVVLAYDPIGWGIPYGSLVTTDTAKSLQETAVQALLILLDYGNPIALSEESSATTGAPLPYVNPEDTDAQGFNVFRRLMGTIQAPDQLHFIYRGFARLLNNIHESESTYLPYSITRIEIEQELLILLWKCLEEIPKFMPYILRYCDITEIVVPICYLLLDGRKEPSKLGLMYLCTFILLKLSGERSFGVALNKPYQLRLPIELPLFNGIHADLIIIVLHKIIVSGLDKLSALYNCFLTIICNISPYCKSLSAVASVKLVNLLQLFTSPKYLYAAEANHAHVSILLETFTNVIQYQYEGNMNLVYSLVRRKDIFESLSALTLDSAVEAAVDLSKKSRRKAEGKAKGVQTAERGKEEPALESKPTDLISTRTVERHVGQEGEVDLTKHPNGTPAPDVPAETEVKEGEANGESAGVTVAPALVEHKAEAPEAEEKTAETVHPPLAELRFTPSQEWLDALKPDIPLTTIMRLLKILVPQVEELASRGTIEELQVLEFIRRTTMVGLLPVPHPIVIRKYQPNKFTSLWFTAFLWGVIFMHNQEIPLFDGRAIKLFLVQTTV